MTRAIPWRWGKIVIGWLAMAECVTQLRLALASRARSGFRPAVDRPPVEPSRAGGVTTCSGSIDVALTHIGVS